MHTATPMELTGITGSELRHTRESLFCMILCMRISRTDKISQWKTEVRIMIVSCWEYIDPEAA